MPHTSSNPEIWLISNQDALLQACKDTLPFPTVLKHFSGLEATKAHLNDQNDPVASPAIILLDVTSDPELILACQQLFHTKLRLHQPLIAIIDRPEARQPALTAGADDYLLVPLLPEEFQRRLDIHLKMIWFMSEHERLHEEVSQNERLATLGRLTAVLSHEINNPMQAIQGAMMLAQETLAETSYTNEDLSQYIELSLKEAERVIELVGRIRQIYRPQTEPLAVINLRELLQDVIRMAQKGMKRQKVTFRTEFPEKLPPITAMANQLHLAFLSILLKFCEILDTAGSGKVHLSLMAKDSMVQVMISADTGVSNAQFHRSRSNQEIEELSLGMYMSRKIILAHNGQLVLRQEANQIICQVKLPIANP